MKKSLFKRLSKSREVDTLNILRMYSDKASLHNKRYVLEGYSRDECKTAFSNAIRSVEYTQRLRLGERLKIATRVLFTGKYR